MIALPAPPPGRSGKANRRLLITGTVMLAALAGWSVVSPIDVVSSATGEVMPVTRVKTVQHLEGGIVSAILVVEGQHVDKGEPLLRLDPIRASSDHDELAAHLKALMARAQLAL